MFNQKPGREGSRKGVGEGETSIGEGEAGGDGVEEWGA